MADVNESSVALAAVEAGLLYHQDYSAGGWTLEIKLPKDAQGLPRFTTAQFQALCDALAVARPSLVKPPEPEPVVVPDITAN